MGGEERMNGGSCVRISTLKNPIFEKVEARRMFVSMGRREGFTGKAEKGKKGEGKLLCKAGSKRKRISKSGKARRKLNVLMELSK